MTTGNRTANDSLTISSPEFSDGGPMPATVTCHGEGRSPALEWSGVPEGTRSLALIADDPDAPDPDAPKMVFVHWVVWDIDPRSAGFQGGITGSDSPHGARQGKNDGGKTGWTPPCPPIGRHRYFFKLYALDTQLGELNGPATTKAELEQAMAGHILAEAVVMGTCVPRA